MVRRPTLSRGSPAGVDMSLLSPCRQVRYPPSFKVFLRAMGRTPLCIFYGRMVRPPHKWGSQAGGASFVLRPSGWLDQIRRRGLAPLISFSPSLPEVFWTASLPAFASLQRGRRSSQRRCKC